MPRTLEVLQGCLVSWVCDATVLMRGIWTVILIVKFDLVVWEFGFWPR